MFNILINNIVRFLVLVLLQTFVFNEINLGVYLNIYLYVLFILLLPFETPGWILLPVCFLLGLMVDVGLNTAGLHTSACTFAAFVRPTVLSFIKPREGYDANASPGLFNMGFSWFLSYSLILIFLHHFWLFTVEAFRFTDIFFILLKVLCSLALNVFMVLITQILISSFNNRNR
jgi:hypothetical protein